MSIDQPIVRLSGVRKSFGRTVAVQPLDLELRRGEFTTLLGPSGCGKSTILRMLGGFERPDAGTITIDGGDVTRLPPERRDVNMVFQDYALFPHMTVARNIAFGLELKGMGKAAIDRRIEQLLALVRLDGVAARTTDQLSGGQRQRVALARALAPDPGVLLLDEPLGALDAKLRQEMQVELKAIQETTGKTFLFVTHDQEEALTMSDRIIVMNAGRVEQDGTPLDLYDRPASRFVATFIGETNLLSCVLHRREPGRLMLGWGANRLEATIGGDAGVAVGGTVEAVLRPEQLTCSGDEPTAVNRLRGMIRRRRFVGHRMMLTVDVEGSGSLDVAMEPLAARALDEGPMWVGFEPGRLTVLPTALERAS